MKVTLQTLPANEGKEQRLVTKRNVPKRLLEGLGIRMPTGDDRLVTEYEGRQVIGNDQLVVMEREASQAEEAPEIAPEKAEPEKSEGLDPADVVDDKQTGKGLED